LQAHGFFDTSNTAANDGNWLQNEYTQLQKAANGKRVVITESGWPHAGSANGAAVADPTSQSTAMAAIKQAFSDKPDSLYLFQAYNAVYKQPGPMGIEQSFGLYGN
jgi:exo-beta-1,3-glucanase (GH17 family)